MDTNAWAYLNISHPICAWATYRGALLPTPDEAGFVSLWVASALAAGEKRADWLMTEMQLEGWRVAYFPELVSRLKGFYVFTDLSSAERALTWSGRHFRPQFLAELHVIGGVANARRFDANWITAAGDGKDLPNDWMGRYWAGIPYPQDNPIWEVLAKKPAYIMGTELRELAYECLKANAANSLLLAETSRIAAWIGSSLGNCSCFLRSTQGDEWIHGEFLMDMRDATNPAVLAAMKAEIDAGHPVRARHLTDLVTPDLTKMNFRVPKSQYPYILPDPKTSTEETQHLLKSPRNTERLLEAVRDLDAGKGEVRELSE